MTDAIPPMVFRWSGEVMVPLHGRIADKHFVIGQDYALVEHHERSAASHNHYFKLVENAWQSLPESIAANFPTSEHLRKYALIMCGYCDQRSIVCSSKAEARRLAAFVGGMDSFALVVPSEAVVTVYTAKSQSMKAMGKATFQASKDAVLGKLEEIIHVEPGRLLESAA